MRRRMEKIPDPKIDDETLSFWKSRFGVEPQEVLMVMAALPFLAVAKVASSIRDATLGRVERGVKRISAKVRDVATGQERYEETFNSGDKSPEPVPGEVEHYTSSFGERAFEPAKNAVKKVRKKVGRQSLTIFEDKEND